MLSTMLSVARVKLQVYTRLRCHAVAGARKNDAGILDVLSDAQGLVIMIDAT